MLMGRILAAKPPSSTLNERYADSQKLLPPLEAGTVHNPVKGVQQGHQMQEKMSECKSAPRVHQHAQHRTCTNCPLEALKWVPLSSVQYKKRPFMVVLKLCKHTSFSAYGGNISCTNGVLRTEPVHVTFGII